MMKWLTWSLHWSTCVWTMFTSLPRRCACTKPSVLSSKSYVLLAPKWPSITSWTNNPWSQGLANRTSEKQRPGPLELTLFFKADSETDLFLINNSSMTIWVLRFFWDTNILPSMRPTSSCRKQCVWSAWEAGSRPFAMCCSMLSQTTTGNAQTR